MNIWMKPPGFWLMFSVKDLHEEGSPEGENGSDIRLLLGTLKGRLRGWRQIPTITSTCPPASLS